MNGIVIASIDTIEHVHTREAIEPFVLAHVDQLEHLTAEEAHAEAERIDDQRATEAEHSVLFADAVADDPSLVELLYGYNRQA